MENRNINPRELLISDYSEYYRRYNSDSPEESRNSIISKIRKIILKGINPRQVLNIGSGPQSIEKNLLSVLKNDKNSLQGLKLISLDIAEIISDRLPQQKLGKKNFLRHVRGDGSQLPFLDNSFGLVFSNHAIDFMPKEAFSEAFRVLNKGGFGVFYFHHPTLLNKTTDKDDSVLNFWLFLKNEGLLFSTEEEIKRFLEKIGFVVQLIELKEQKLGNDKWWEVVVNKP